MSGRLKLAAWLHVAAGVFIGSVVTTLWVCAEMLASTFEGSFVPDLFAMFGRPIAVALWLCAAFQIAAGLSLRARLGWARGGLTAIALIEMAIFPIGSALSAFTFWALWTGQMNVAVSPPNGASNSERQV